MDEAFASAEVEAQEMAAVAYAARGKVDGVVTKMVLHCKTKVDDPVKWSALTAGLTEARDAWDAIKPKFVESVRKVKVAADAVAKAAEAEAVRTAKVAATWTAELGVVEAETTADADTDVDDDADVDAEPADRV
jgi:hypothetical protein